MRGRTITQGNRSYVTIVTLAALLTSSSVLAQQLPPGPRFANQANAPSNQLSPVAPYCQPVAPPNFQQRALAPPPQPAANPSPTVRADATAAQPVQRASYQLPPPPARFAQNSGAAISHSPSISGGDLPPPGRQSQAAPQANGWSLEQVQALALEYNPTLRESLAQIESAAGDARQASLYPNPRFDTNNPYIFAGTASSYNAGFVQPIVVKGKLRLDRAAANEIVRQKEYGFLQNRFALLMAIRQQFYTVLAAQRRVEVLRELREIAAAAVRAAEGRRQATEGTLSEVLLIQTELQRAEIALRNGVTALDASRRQLAAIVGRPDVVFERAVAQLASGFPDFNENGLREFVVSQNTQVQIARLEIDRNQILLRRARVEPYPNVTVGPAFGNNLLIAPNTQQFWFNLRFEIPTWNRNQGNIYSTRADVRDSLAGLGVLQNELLRQVEDALGRYRSARQSEERIRTAILPTAQRAQQLAKNGYEQGVLDFATFLQAQMSLSEASLSYIDALQDVWTIAAEIANLYQLERFPY
jgi:cobalt-zinc-cadmium efflux system outer membrane protein